MVHNAPAVGAEGGSPGTEAEGAQPMDGGAARDRGSTTLGFDEAGFVPGRERVVLVSCGTRLYGGFGGIDTINDDAIREPGVSNNVCGVN
jgi:hypothetical protein